MNVRCSSIPDPDRLIETVQCPVRNELHFHACFREYNAHCILRTFIFQFLRLSQNSQQHKLHYIRDTRVKFVISETSDPGDPRLTSGDPDTVALLCFSLSRGLNLASVVSSWSSVSSNISTVLVGTMADTRDTAVNYNQAMAVAEQIGAVTYMETSSKQSYTSVTSTFETAAMTVMPSLCRQPPTLTSDLMTSTRLRHSGKSRRGQGELSKAASLEYNKHSGSSTLTAAKKMFSLSSGSLHSKSSTLSSNKSNSSVLSVSTGRTPMLGRRNQRRVMEEEEQMVKIRVERLTRDKQVEEVEIEIPRSVYSNMRENTEAESDFVRNSGKRKSLAYKLKNLILR